ncbi:MAG: DinB family protein [Ignavibacteria bacterium]|nr:DinB family protein [Ignavibacteria bacterium]
MSEKDMFINAWDNESKTTARVLKAYPEAKLDLKPSEKSRTARELAWTIVGGEMVVGQTLDGKIDFTPGPPPPATMKEIVQTYEKVHADVLNKVKNMSDKDLETPIKFFTAPKQMGDIPRSKLLWFILMDNVHHRGQLSVYLRMAGGKLPSIYGPTADEPWM